MSDGKMIVERSRVFERGRGCWSCIYYENGDIARKRWKERRSQDELEIRLRAGEFDLISQPPEPGDARFRMLDNMDKAVSAGVVGMCMAGKARTDFVHHQYLCDHWTGRTGASVATAGRPVDPLPAELYEIAEDRAKKSGA